VKGVWFEQNGIRISSKGNVNTDGTVSITFNNGFAIKSNENIDLVVQLDTDAGAQISFRIANVDSTAKNLSIRDKVTTVYHTALYTVAKTVFEGRGTTGDYKMGEQTSYLLGEFAISNDTGTGDDKNVKVQSLVLKQNGGADLTNLRNVKVYRDSKVVSSEVKLDSKSMTIVLNDVIESGRKALYSIEAEITYVDRDKDVYQLYLNKAEDLVAVEQNTNFRTTNTIETNKDALATYNVKGGKMLFTNQTGFPTNINAGSSYTDVVVASGTFTVTEPIVLDTLTLSANTSGNQDLNKLISRVTLEIGGNRHQGTIYSTGVVFDTEFYINRTSSVKILANIGSNIADGNWFTIGQIKGLSFKKGHYQNSDANFDRTNDVAGIISPARVTIQASTFNLVKTSNESEKTVVKDDSTPFTFYEGTLSNKLSSNVTVNTITLSGTGTSAEVMGTITS
jgi:hypothetical protein